MNQIIEQAYTEAKAVRENAYAKFSGFHVGSALKIKGNPKIFTGCNVENSTYGLTICAERTAIVKMISETGDKNAKIEFVVVVADTEEATPPCGMCLQSLFEFSDSETEVYLSNLQSIVKKYKLLELLPHGFRFEV